MVLYTCPDRHALNDFLSGRLPADELERIAEHLDACADCETAVDELETFSDPLIEEIRRPVDSLEFLEERQLKQALDRMRHRTAIGSDRTDPMEGRRLDSYRILEKLGEGGVGTVYKALHLPLEKVVALKTLSRARLQERRSLDRFRREMKAVGCVDHPRLVRATDGGEADGVPFLVMEFVDGVDLAEALRRHGPLPVSEACAVVRQAALGLQAVHERGMVHRDIKPANLMLSRDGAVKVLDLGLARLHRQDTTDGLTRVGQIMGTVDYMAPEQFLNSHQVDIRADIYSLGCTLSFLLTGRPPFPSETFPTLLEKMKAHTETPPPDLDLPGRDLPRNLQTLVQRMLAKDPAERFETPAKLADALQDLADESRLPALADRLERMADPEREPAGGRRRKETSDTALAETDVSTTAPVETSRRRRWK